MIFLVDIKKCTLKLKFDLPIKKATCKVAFVLM